MFGRNRKHVHILKHHRSSAVYVDGRYLHTDMKVSTRSKRGREIARETCSAILAEVGANEGAFDLLQLNIERMNKGEAVEKREGHVIPMPR